METQNNTYIIAAAIIIAGFLVALGIFASKSPNNAATGTEGGSIVAEADINVEEVAGTDHIRGNADAKVVMVEYSDIQCPFCQQFHAEVKATSEAFAPTDFAWVYRHFPLDQIHPHARRYAEASECVASIGGNTAFNGFLDALITKAAGAANLPAGITDAELATLATAQGVSANQLKACLSTEAPKEAVQTDYQEAIAAGGQGTPYNVFLLKEEVTDEAREALEAMFATAGPGAVVISEDGKRVAIGGGLPRETLTEVVNLFIGE